MTENQTMTTRKRIDAWRADYATLEPDSLSQAHELLQRASTLLESVRRMEYRLLDGENQVADDALVYHTNYLADAFVDRGIKDPDREQVLDFLYDIETSGDEEGLIFFAGKARGLQEARQIYDIST